jgi:NAD(P)-dependent dehydrogenase (short-subunit alcohol dehydrogenase family)
MEVRDKVAVITGGASGIGKALALRFHRAGARGIVIADLDRAGAEAVAAEVGGIAVPTDVSQESDVAALAAQAIETFGAIDLMCSNAGISMRDPDPDLVTSASNELWQRGWEMNVMAHVYAARAVLPGMIEQGGGYFLHTVSAAGVLSQPGSPGYATTKHAAIGFAEALAITHRHQNIRVSVLCPQAVDTPLLKGATGTQSLDGIISPEAVADCALEAILEERFLALPHPQVLTYMRRKTDDYDRWIAGMARLRDKAAAARQGD